VKTWQSYRKTVDRIEARLKHRETISVRVNHDLVLDAGTYEGLDHSKRSEWVRAPSTTLFRQVLAYLLEKPDPVQRPTDSYASRDGVAATALVLRWGSYLCVLLDGTNGLQPLARSADLSCISDGEMARINIEASAALAEWIDLRRTDAGLHARVVERALAYLPMSPRRVRMRVLPFAGLANIGVATTLIETADPARLARARFDVERNATRVFANALVNVAWRNGPVEDLHAGTSRSDPLEHRRITPARERALMCFAAERFAVGFAVCDQFMAEHPPRPWSEQVLPFALADILGVTPSDWTLTESSRDVRISNC